jgi:putative transposase
VGAIARDCGLLIRDKCAERGWEVVALELHPDYVHLRVRVTPGDPAADVARAVKRHTSNVLRGRYPALLQLPSLWTRSYLASTAEMISPATIRRYVNAQKGV